MGPAGLKHPDQLSVLNTGTALRRSRPSQEQLIKSIHSHTRMTLAAYLGAYIRNTFEPVREKPTICVPTRSDTKKSVQLQKQARSLKFRILKEGLYYPCS